MFAKGACMEEICETLKVSSRTVYRYLSNTTPITRITPIITTTSVTVPQTQEDVASNTLAEWAHGERGLGKSSTPT